VLAGAWVIMYGLAELLPRFGVRTLDEVLFSSSRLQGSISSAITDWGTPVLVTIVSLMLVAVVVVFSLARRDALRATSSAAPTSPSPAVDSAAPSTSPATATQDVLDAVRRAASRR